MKKDYYRILGVREDASAEEIKRQYRILAKKYHPDGNPGSAEAERRFREAGEAYGVLGDQEKRRQYDRERKAREKKGKTEAGSRGREEMFFGFRPGSSQAEEEKREPNRKTRANPIDVTEMFERYMGIKK